MAWLLPLYHHVVHECHVEHVERESIILKITEKAQQAIARCVCVGGWMYLCVMSLCVRVHCCKNHDTVLAL